MLIIMNKDSDKQLGQELEFKELINVKFSHTQSQKILYILYSV